METKNLPEAPPTKRRRLSSDDYHESRQTSVAGASGHSSKENAGSAATPAQSQDEQTEKEIKLGITAFVNPETPGFSGVLKQR